MKILSVLMRKKKTNKDKFNKGSMDLLGSMDTKDKIEKILHNNLSIKYLKITNDSDKHIGHSEVQKKRRGDTSLLLLFLKILKIKQSFSAIA